MKDIAIPNVADIRKGCEEFERHETRDAMYRVATFIIEHYWGKPPDMADGLGVLLLTWNQAFYRYGLFDFNKLEKCLKDNFHVLESFRHRDIIGLTKSDEDHIEHLFNNLLDALQIDSGKNRGTSSPVAVAKALHLLAPAFFPLWDKKIAHAYNCSYGKDAARKYITFCGITKAIAAKIKDHLNRKDKTVTKQFDEYNYSKYTKGWI